jgi:hypothetical protein
MAFNLMQLFSEKMSEENILIVLPLKNRKEFINNILFKMYKINFQLHLL